MVKYGCDKKITHSAKLITSLLCAHSKEVWGHCQRVALLSEKTAEIMGKDKKAAFFAGLLHDLGKIFVRKELFSEQNITGEEYKEVKEHALKGYSSLKDIHLFTALCCGLHHAVGENGYGLSSKNLPRKMRPNTLKKALDISTIVSVCDFIDAFCTRKTKIKDGSNSNGTKKPGLKKSLLKQFPEDKIVIVAALKTKNILKPKRNGVINNELSDL